jgi:alanyl-tRNA synthetase
MMTSSQIRQSFLDFFKSKQHTIVPSSSLMPDSPNLLFTNAGMNQFVPIFLGQTKCPYTPGRAADTQKCIRAGGKHNDLDDVGLDTYHHTFFEMLGNWSFGDYFKREAIDWAWELVVMIWKFPPQRLYATVYNPDKTKNDPSEFDQEAWNFWAEKFRSVGLDPAVHIVNGNKKDNFWMMGETGPCGPCSELHVDLTPDGDTRGSLVNKGDARCIEIWNLVFIQFNANPDGTFSPLPAKHVDTGMGFERVTSIIQGTKNFSDFANAKISNYETDIFRPIFDELEKLSGKKYGSTLPGDAIAKVATEEEPLKTSGEARGNIIEVEAEERGAHHGSTGDDDDGFPVATASAEQIALDIAFRVIADHIRTLSFAIADGIQPGNTDRNYVLRRILRRAVRYGRTLGFREPFFYKLVDVLADTMGDVFPEIRARKKQVQETIRTEEEAFNKTLDRGIELFENAEERSLLKAIGAKGFGTDEYALRFPNAPRPDGVTTIPILVMENGTTEDLPLRGLRENFPDFLKRAKTVPLISAEDAFQLYDTYGFPFDLTELMAREHSLTVDKDGFEKLMEEQRARARAAQKKEVISLSQIETTAPTKFTGFEKLESPARVIEVVSVKDKTAVVLDTSPFYAEMGGQVGDTGELILNPVAADVSRLISSIGADSRPLLQITSTQKSGNTFLHFVEGENLPAIGDEVFLRVKADRRNAIQRHHTVTHLLHWALHEVASKEASQKGSFVGPDKLTFDFNSAPLTPAQVADIEKLVNERILENAGVSWTEVAHADVKQRKDVMQFFGDKYGDTVRVVQIGGHAGKLDGYSMELCGGTHTRATGEIGLFRIVGESAIAAGVRRIEAVAGLEAYRKANEELHLIKTLAGKVNSPVHELDKKIELLLAHQKELKKELKARDQREAADKAQALYEEWKLQAPNVSLQPIQNQLGGIPMILHKFKDASSEYLQVLADAVKQTGFKGVVVFASATGDNVSLLATVSPEFTSKIQAGKIIQTIAPIIGGKGGGKPDNARGGGKDASKLDEALAKTKTLLGG